MGWSIKLVVVVANPAGDNFQWSCEAAGDDRGVGR